MHNFKHFTIKFVVMMSSKSSLKRFFFHKISIVVAHESSKLILISTFDIRKFRKFM